MKTKVDASNQQYYAEEIQDQHIHKNCHMSHTKDVQYRIVYIILTTERNIQELISISSFICRYYGTQTLANNKLYILIQQLLPCTGLYCNMFECANT